MWSCTSASDIFPYTNHFGNITSNEDQTSRYYLQLYYILILLFSKLNSDNPTEWSKILKNSLVWITSWAAGQAVCVCSLSTLYHSSLKIGLWSDITHTQKHEGECHNTKHQNLDKEVRNFINLIRSTGYERDNDGKTKHRSAVLLNIYSTKHQRKFRTASHHCEGYQSINPLACTECGDSLPFSGASSIPPCHTLFPATSLRRPFFHPPSLHPAIYFVVYLLVLLFPDSYTILFWEPYFLPFSVHVQTNVIYAALLFLSC